MKNESSNYMKVVEMSYEEKVAMYMDINKDILVKMLIECNRCLEARGPQSPENSDWVTTTNVTCCPPTKSEKKAITKNLVDELAYFIEAVCDAGIEQADRKGIKKAIRKVL